MEIEHQCQYFIDYVSISNASQIYVNSKKFCSLRHKFASLDCYFSITRLLPLPLGHLLSPLAATKAIKNKN